MRFVQSLHELFPCPNPVSSLPMPRPRRLLDLDLRRRMPTPRLLFWNSDLQRFLHPSLGLIWRIGWCPAHAVLTLPWPRSFLRSSCFKAARSENLRPSHGGSPALGPRFGSPRAVRVHRTGHAPASVPSVFVERKRRHSRRRNRIGVACPELRAWATLSSSARGAAWFRGFCGNAATQLPSIAACASADGAAGFDPRAAQLRPSCDLPGALLSSLVLNLFVFCCIAFCCVCLGSGYM